MATSTSDDVYVWAWLPGETDPVPAGLLRQRSGAGLSFRYGRSWIEGNGPQLLFDPLSDGPAEGGRWYPPTQNLGLPAALRDASPDNWGRRVIINRRFGAGAEGDTSLLSERDYLIESGSNRLGAVDFQHTATDYVPRLENANLDELTRAADLVNEGTPLPQELAEALVNGTAIGGARPKALINSSGHEYIAKFSTTDDVLDVVGAEAASIFLAKKAGIPVTRAQIVHSMNRKTLLLERFDRPGEGTRRGVVSGLTMLGGPESFTVFGSYPELLDVLRRKARDPEGLGKELFRRVAFNIAISNTDDHLRNHAAFWDGTHLELTPAYDLSPVLRSGHEADQAIPFGRDGTRRSNLNSLIGRAADYSLSRPAATEIAEGVEATIRDHWDDAAAFAELREVDRHAFWGRLFLNPGALY